MLSFDEIEFVHPKQYVLGQMMLYYKEIKKGTTDKIRRSLIPYLE